MQAILTFECSDALLGLDITPVEFLGLQAQQMFDIKATKIDIQKSYNLAEWKSTNGSFYIIVMTSLYTGIIVIGLGRHLVGYISLFSITKEE